MAASILRIDHLYWRALRRFVPVPVTSSVVREPGDTVPIAPKVGVWDMVKLKEGELAVEGMSGGVYVFSASVLADGAVTLLAAIKDMPMEVRASSGAAGIPWFMAHRHQERDRLFFLETTEHLVAMCMAMGFLTVVGKWGEGCPVSYVSMDDVALVRKGKLGIGFGLDYIRKWFS